jgi:serine/threonine protein phosphatase PrpC
MLRVSEQYAASDTGRQRRINEDSLLARAPLFVVADGMGGAQAGEVASRIAVESFDEGGITAEPFDGHTAVTDSPEGRLAAQALAANTRIHELSQSDADHAGMGTTLTAVYVGELEVAIAHVGDSRAYCWREGELLRLTDDHSLVDELIRQGRLTPEEAADHPQRSIITRALGPEEAVEVDTRSFRARSADVYLLCSDGLTTMVSEARLAEVLGEHARLRDAGEALIAEANEAGGRDNITVILLRVEEVSAAGGEVSTATGAIAEAARIDGAGSERMVGTSEGTTGTSEGTTGTTEGMAGAPAGQSVSAETDTARHATLTKPPPATARVPRRPTSSPPPRARAHKRWRRVGATLVVLAVLGVVLAGAYEASQSVYFLATNSRGLVTLYRGVPYELPGGVKLYNSDFVSGVSAAMLSPQRRRTLLDHSLRSQGDAEGLVRSLELGELSEG